MSTEPHPDLGPELRADQARASAKVGWLTQNKGGSQPPYLVHNRSQQTRERYNCRRETQAYRDFTSQLDGVTAPGRGFEPRLTDPEATTLHSVACMLQVRRRSDFPSLQGDDDYTQSTVPAQ